MDHVLKPPYIAQYNRVSHRVTETYPVSNGVYILRNTPCIKLRVITGNAARPLHNCEAQVCHRCSRGSYIGGSPGATRTSLQWMPMTPHKPIAC